MKTKCAAAGPCIGCFSMLWLFAVLFWFGSVEKRSWGIEPTSEIPFYGQEPISLAGSGGAKLHPFWAQRVIGSDLIPGALNDWKDVTEVPVGVADWAFFPEYFTGAYSEDAVSEFLAKDDSESRRKRAGGAHGTGSVNLINGAHPVGVAVRARIVALATLQRDSDFKHVSDIFERARPWLVNVSLSPVTPEAGNYLKRLAEHFIVVSSAGNDYPDRAFLEGKVFRVGSVGPMGFATLTSQEGSLLWAPADFWIKTRKGAAAYDIFAETSAAANLLTGALANVLSIIPGANSSELKRLLLGTVLKTANALQDSHLNGYGTVNALKLVEVAKRLKTRGWPEERETLLSAADLFDFTKESQSEFELGNQELMHKAGARGSAFDRIRRAYLLDDQNEAARQQIIATYRKVGLGGDADFFRSLREWDLKDLIQEKLAADARGVTSEHNMVASGAARTAGMLAVRDALPLLEEALKSPHLEVKTHAVLALRHLGIQGMPLLRHAIEERDESLWPSICKSLLYLWDEGVPLQSIGPDGIDAFDRHARTAFSDYREFQRAVQVSSLLKKGQYSRQSTVLAEP